MLVDPRTNLSQASAGPPLHLGRSQITFAAMTLLMLFNQPASRPRLQSGGVSKRRRGVPPSVVLMLATTAAAMAATIVCVTHPKTAVIPGAEANQGLLSLLALAAALAVAVFENARALGQGDQERREFVEAVVQIIDEIDDAAAASEERIRTRVDPTHVLEEFQRALVSPRFLVDSLRHRAPSDAPLALAVTRLWTELQINQTGLAAMTTFRDVLAARRNDVLLRR